MSKAYTIRRPVLAFTSGACIGVLGGLIGLGGAEFRLPLLLTLFGLFPHRAVRFNLLVSFITLAFAALTRLNIGAELTPHLDIVAAMIAGGVLSAWIGAHVLAAIPVARLMSLISALLFGIALLLLAEATLIDLEIPHLAHEASLRLAGAVLAGLLVGAISSVLGVAGGEFIIPTLIFGFGVDIATAGTLSLIVSLPVVGIGIFRHASHGYYRSRDVLVFLVAPMGAGSVAGAIIGGVLASSVSAPALKIALAAVLVASAIKLRHHALSR